MPSTADDYAKIEEARNRVSNLTKQAGELDAGAYTFRDEVMKNVRDARAARGITNLQEDFGRATEQLATGRGQIVDRNKGELNPLTINQITDQQRGQALGTIAKISQYEAQNSGTIDEAIQAGGNVMQAQAAKIKAQADAAATELQNLMQVVQQKQAEAQAALENSFRDKQFNEGVRQYNQNYALDKIKASQSGSGGGGITGVTSTKPTSTKPTSKPTGKMQSFSSPPMSAKAGTVVQYPPGSGTYWTSTGGGWK